MRRSLEAMLRTIKSRVRRGAWQFSDPGFKDFLDDARLRHQDVIRAFATARLAGYFEDALDRNVFILRGFGMDEEPVVVLCRVVRTRVVVAAAFACPDAGLPGPTPPPLLWQGRGWPLPP